ncbi:MAG: hypothetical protein ACJASB_003966 [Shewanella psychromarinicola]|jgi:hypothetical protein
MCSVQRVILRIMNTEGLPLKQSRSVRLMKCLSLVSDFIPLLIAVTVDKLPFNRLLTQLANALRVYAFEG